MMGLLEVLLGLLFVEGYSGTILVDFLGGGEGVSSHLGVRHSLHAKLLGAMLPINIGYQRG